MTTAKEAKEDKGEEETLELVAHCLCKAHRFTALVPRSSLPLKAAYCHCTSCRRVTGALHSTYVPWPGDAAAILAAGSLRRYVYAPHLTLFSCRVCSSNMFVEKTDVNDPPNYGVQTGVLTNIDVPGLINITNHVFLDDTLDGGASPWLCDANRDGSRPRLWRGARGQSQELSSTHHHHWPVAEAGLSRPSADTDIPVRCHCGGVDLVHHQPMADFAARERSELPWFVDPVSNKLRASFDACDSCRLSSGSDVYYWTFVLLHHLAFPAPKSDGQPQPKFPKSSLELRAAVSSADKRDPRWGTLTFYESSPDVQRYFCSRCAACVFYASDDRPEMVDLAIGLLDSGDGARAESLLAWDYGDKVGWRQDVVGGWREGFVESIETAAERWRIERDYPKSWRRRQMEEQKVSPIASNDAPI
ncbi:Mss4-like protein [Xylaria flabelliformis]|nr:Mss4-like protein [Xylaria flabelliformis]